MQLPDLKQLDKLIALCRKRGVTVIKIDNMELTLSESAPVKSSKKQDQLPQSSASLFESDTLTDEQLLNWSIMEVPTGNEEPGAN